MGANGLSIAPLELKTLPALDINFYTNFNVTTTPRMTIIGNNNIGGWADNTGYVGIYTYSLIVDGKLIDTKKMVKQH